MTTYSEIIKSCEIMWNNRNIKTFRRSWPPKLPGATWTPLEPPVEASVDPPKPASGKHLPRHCPSIPSHGPPNPSCILKTYRRNSLHLQPPKPSGKSLTSNWPCASGSLSKTSPMVLQTLECPICSYYPLMSIHIASVASWCFLSTPVNSAQSRWTLHDFGDPSGAQENQRPSPERNWSCQTTAPLEGWKRPCWMSLQVYLQVELPCLSLNWRSRHR